MLFIQKAVIGGSNFHDGLSLTPGSLTVPTNTTNYTEVSNMLIANFLQKYFPLSSSDVEEVMEMYPISDFANGHARGAEMYQDVTMAW